MLEPQQLIDQLWDFNDPTISESRFREAMNRAADSAQRLQLQTQLARAQGLQQHFDAAHGTLNEVLAFHAPKSDSTSPHHAFGAVGVRCLLERGRLFNSSNQRDQALPFFMRAFESAVTIHDDHLAIDAAHMIAIVHGGQDRPAEAMRWNRRALEMAEASAQPRARQWRGSLHNNIGWTLHDQGDFASALSHFEKAFACRLEENNPRDIRIARWCIGRCQRSLHRIDEALALQAGLLEEHERAGAPPDGFVHEEIAECLLALHHPAQAAPHFAKAHQLLGRDSSFAAQQPERLARLRHLGGVESAEQPHPKDAG